MAVSALTPSELEARRLRATKGQLDQRWAKVSEILATEIQQRPRDVAVEADYQANGVWTGLRGAMVERIERNRGTASVAPFLKLPDDLVAWLGYQEVWDAESGRAPYAFRQASLTIHLGDVGDPVKPQLLRLEWPGLRDWDRSGVGFQSYGAGHPHWQIDVLESLRDMRADAAFEPDAGIEVETFEPQHATRSLSERIGALELESMHLASAAPWWSDRPAEFGMHHLNAPDSQEALLRWLRLAIAYMKQELARSLPRR